MPQPGGLGTQKAARASGLLVTEGAFLSPCWRLRRNWPPVVREEEEETGCGSHTRPGQGPGDLDFSPGSTLTYPKTLGMSLHVSEPQFPHEQKEGIRSDVI